MSAGENARKRTPYFRLWCAFFAYSAVVAILVQLVVLPYFVPQWHAGDGLLIGGDWLTHHRLAVELAEKIHSQGWRAWTLRPDGQAPAGIAGAIYALTVPKPWILIPLNAILHATAALVLLLIVQFFIPSWRQAIWAVLPFFLYPTTLLWTTQILNDGYSIAGFFLFVYGWLSLARLETWKRVRWLPLLPLVWALLGAFLIWIVRPYMLQMVQVIGAGLALLLTGVFLYRFAQKSLCWHNTLIGTGLFWGIILVLFLVPHLGGRVVWEEVSNTPEPTTVQRINWQRSSWLPQVLEDVFYSLATVRERSRTLYPDARSNVDVNVGFESAGEVISYIPRAGELAFLAPFPYQWFDTGSLPITTLMRRVSIVEMIGVYLGLISFPLALWRWQNRIEMWSLTVFCVGMMISYGLVIANVGSLYRARYGFLMALVALGIAGGLTAYHRWSYRSRTKHNSVLDP